MKAFKCLLWLRMNVLASAYKSAMMGEAEEAGEEENRRMERFRHRHTGGGRKVVEINMALAQPNTGG